MARFMIKASEYKNVCKSVNDRKLAELKKEIIEILKKQDEKEVKKAIDYFNSQEFLYTHLEKSFTGKWIEKAGYGIGTVRIWKGKKYKKIAPGKWARVFEKEGRGTNIAIGKLISRVQKIDNVEDLMAFVMQNKQRFVDENGVDLPVLDKLRAAVDARNGNVGSKGTSKPAEKKKTFKQEMKELYDAQDKAWEGFESGSEIKSSPENSKKFYDKVKKFVDDNNIKLSQKHYDEIEEMNGHSFNEALELAGAYGAEKREKAIAKNKEINKKYKGALLDLSMIDEFKESDDGNKTYWIQDSKGNRITNEDAKKRLMNDIENLKEYKNEYLLDRLNPEDRKEIESEFEKTKNRSDAMKGNKNAYKGGSEKPLKTTKSPFKVFADKSSVGTFTKVDENTVEMPSTRETVALFDSLKKSVSKDDTRPFMTDCYYDGENIISTDGRRLVCIKAGDIGIEPGYVKVNSDGNKIKLEKFEKDFGKSQVKQFPNYKRVMPNNNTQEVQLNQKVLKEKLKTMKKEGAWGTKENVDVAFEFEDGKVMLDGVQVGTADGVKFDSDEQILRMNGEQLFDAMGTADNVTMFVSDNPTKAVSLSDSVSDIVMMPMYGDENSVPDYEARRAKKAGAKAEKAAKLSKNREANERLLSEAFKDIDGQVERVYSNVDKKISDFSDEELKRNYDILNLNLDKIMDRSIYYVGMIVDKKTNASFATAYAYSKLKEKHPDVKEKFLAELEKRGISVKKSLFDDFITDMLVDEVIEDEEEDEENESEYNDYSAEQPELFNSTEFLVREALNRRYNCM